VIGWGVGVSQRRFFQLRDMTAGTLSWYHSGGTMLHLYDLLPLD
jgi:hypothetical protein